MSQTLMPLYPTLGGSKVGAAVHRVIARTLVASGKPMEALPHLEEMDRMLVGVKQPKSLASSRRAWDEYRQAISK